MHYFSTYRHLSIFTLFVWIQKGNTESLTIKKRRENGEKQYRMNIDIT